MLHGEIPALIVRSAQSRVHAGHTWIDCLAWIERRKSLRHRKRRRISIDEGWFIKKWKVVRQLQRSCGANFLPAEEYPIGPANHCVRAGSRSPGKADPRRKVRLVHCHQTIRSAA